MFTAQASCEVSRVSCTWVCTDSPQCGFVTRQPTTRAALRTSRLETDNALDDAEERVDSVSSPVVSDPASDEEVGSSNPDCYRSHGLHATEECCSLQDGTSKTVCNVCRLLRVLQPPAPRGSSSPRNDPKPERVEPRTIRGRSLTTENKQNTFSGNRERTEHVPWQQETNKTRSLATENDHNTFPSNRERSEHVSWQRRRNRTRSLATDNEKIVP
ncbi:hypothetical protein Bbelb_387940 [Branchiostoma belcheri]|nr:hypothetical protein Bbelb_387940 [Branchiostoma belcheri]